MGPTRLAMSDPTNRTWTMDLTPGDLKKLRFQKGVTLFMLSTMFFALTILVGVGTSFVISGVDETVGGLLTVAAIVILGLTLWVRRHYRGLKADIKGGIKEAVQGKIQNKMRHRSNCDFTINGVTYHVNMDAYQSFKVGDQVLIAFGPHSKVMLDIQRIKE